MNTTARRSATPTVAKPTSTASFATQRPFTVQTKLTVGAPGDRYEQEADRVADQVMRMPAGNAAMLSGAPPKIQRLCGECEEELQRQAEVEEEKEEEELLQTKSKAGASTTAATSEVSVQVHSLRGGGQSLPESTRAFFEPRFGHDFSEVRVHTDHRAASSAQALNALAYTSGRDIAFAAGQYAPDTQSGGYLLAHELTHVVQQGGGRGQRIQRHVLENDPSTAPGMRCDVATSSPSGVSLDFTFNIGGSTLSDPDKAAVSNFVRNWHLTTVAEPVRVDGYASIDGPPSVNWSLSCRRAEVLANEMKTPFDRSPGIPESSITLFAQGETEQFSAALEPNRRVQAHIPSAPTPPAPPPLSCAHPGGSRNLDLQPVFLRTSAADPSPTGASWTRRFNESNAIWGKIGVTFNALSPITLNTPLKTSGSAGSVAALRTGSGVEIFAVDNDLSSSGGAVTLGPLAALCNIGKIVMSDRGTSDTLLAHELGHILGIQHPGTPPNPGDPSTIMVGSSSHSVANSRRNTMVNFSRVLCPAPSGSTCLNPDP